MNGQEPSGCVSRCFLETQPPNKLDVIHSFDSMTPFFSGLGNSYSAMQLLSLSDVFLSARLCPLVFRCLTTRRVPGRGCEKEARQQESHKDIPNKNPGNFNREFLTDPDSDDKDSRCLAPGLLSGPFAQNRPGSAAPGSNLPGQCKRNDDEGLFNWGGPDRIVIEVKECRF